MHDGHDPRLPKKFSQVSFSKIGWLGVVVADEELDMIAYDHLGAKLPCENYGTAHLSWASGLLVK
jgi:hypothetical protein